MSGPMMPRREAMPLDQMLADTDRYLDVDKMIERMAPAQVGNNFKPTENLAKFLYLLSRQNDARELFEWLMDLTVRAPYPHVNDSFEQAALAAAKHQARAGVGEVILEAIALGKRLIDEANQRT